MVFETLVANLLNKYLGEFVVNLDKSQLNIGIWGGDVELENLQLRDGALDKFNLPIRVHKGFLHKLVLKVPWKNLYSQAATATIDGLYILAGPRTDFAYDSEQERKNKRKEKLAQLENLEKSQTSKSDDKESFAEKLGTLVVKNLQIFIRSVHIRYEDNISDVDVPLAFGITLENLSAETTNDNWNPAFMNDDNPFIFKFVRLDNLDIYWDLHAKSFQSLNESSFLSEMKNRIMPTGSLASEIQYIIHPINAHLKLKINSKPKKNETVPKITNLLHCYSVVVSLTKMQYESILKWLQLQELLMQKRKYTKYRPNYPLHRNASKWWKFAYNCITNEDLQISSTYSWNRIFEYRQARKAYERKYLASLSQKKPPESLVKELEELEDILDMGCIAIIRRKMERKMNISRGSSKQKNSGWFSSIFGSSSKDNKEKKTNSLGLSDQELQELRRAIDFNSSESTDPTSKEYIDFKLTLSLENYKMDLKDGKRNILKVAVTDIAADVARRPVKNGISVCASLRHFNVLGSERNGFEPCIIQPQPVTDSSTGGCFSVLFEKYPLESVADQKITIQAPSVEIWFDTISALAVKEFFVRPQDVEIEQLSHAASYAIQKLKDNTKKSITAAVKDKAILDIDVKISSTYVVVPSNVDLRSPTNNLLIADLGSLQVKSDLSLVHQPDKNCDRFSVGMQNIQILLANKEDDWNNIRKASLATKLHILFPSNIALTIEKSLQEESADIPEVEISGTLSKLAVSVSDKKLLTMLKLADSVNARMQPILSGMPESKKISPITSTKKKGNALIHELGSHIKEIKSFMEEDKVSENEDEFYSASDCEDSSTEIYQDINKTKVQLQFVIEEIHLDIFETKEAVGELHVLAIHFQQMESGFTLRKYDLNVTGGLKGFSIMDPNFNDDKGLPLQLLDASTCTENSNLLSFKYIKITSPASELYKRDQIRQSVVLELNCVTSNLHYEELASVIHFFNNLAEDSQEIMAKKGKEMAYNSSENDTKSIIPSEDQDIIKKTDPFTETDCRLKVKAKLQLLQVNIIGKTGMIASIKIADFSCNMDERLEATRLYIGLGNIHVTDEISKHRYRKIISIDDDETLFALNLTLYKHDQEQYLKPETVDIDVTTTLGQSKVVILQGFIVEVVNFVSHFQSAILALKAARKRALQTAMKTVKNLRSHETRLRLNVSMKAPILIIPQSSSSHDAVLIDLGRLTIRNSFKIADDSKNYTDRIPILDAMEIKLTATKLSRVFMSLEGDFDVLHECKIIPQADLKILITRNLSTSWYDAITPITINSELEEFEIFLGDKDIALALAILENNVKEGVFHKDPSQADPTTDNESESFDQIEDKPAKVNEIALDFKATRINLTLYNEVKTLNTGGPSAFKRLSEFCLLRLESSGFSLQFTETKSERMLILSLNNFMVEDMRPVQSNGETRILERYNEKTAADVPVKASDMFRVTYISDRVEWTKVDVVVDHFCFRVCVDFIMSLKSYAESLIDTALKLPRKRSASDIVKPLDVKPTNMEFKVTVMIVKPEIMLVSDPLRKDSPYVKCSSEIQLNLLKNNEKILVEADIKDSYMVSVAFGEKRRQYSIQVLHPCDIKCNVLIPSDGKGKEIKVSTGKILFHISSSLMQTLIAVSKALRQNQIEDDEVSFQEVPADLWEVKKTNTNDFAYLTSDDEKSLVSVSSTNDIQTLTNKPDASQFVFQSEQLKVVFETSTEDVILPLVSCYMTVNACAKDWENNLCFDADLALESYYYNNRVSEWEPLIEPIEENSVFKPWTLKLSVRKGEAKAGVADSTETDMYSYETGSQSEISTTESFSGIENDAKMTVTLSSTKTLQFTVTKTCLSVLKTLADDLTGSKSWGASLDENTRKQAEGIELRNLTGFNATITPGYAFDRKFEKFTLLDKGSEFLSLRESFVRVEGDKVINQRTVYLQPERTVFADKVMLTCKVNKYAELCDIPVARAGKQLFGIKRVKDGIMSLVLDTEVIGNRKIVTIRSSLQVKNSLEFAIQLYSSEDRQLHHLATIHPNDIASVPLSATYDSKLFITPIVDGILFNSHKEPVDWKVLYAMKAQDSSRKASKVYLCKSDSGHQFVFKVKMRSENYHSVDRLKLPVERLQDSTPHFVLNVTPSIVLRNALPYAISYRLEGSGKHEVLKEGKKCSLYSVIPTAKQVIQIELLDYLGMNWHGSFAINNIVMGSTDKQGLILTSKNIKDKTVELQLMRLYVENLEISISASHLMINDTNFPLCYKGVDGRTVVEHPPSVNPIIFSTNSKNFFSSGKISCSVPGFTKWSDGFSIDAVGNAGCIQCHNLKDKNLFEIGISSSLSNFGLTKFVKFSPFHVISNQTNYAITCMESGVNNPYSVMVPAGKVIPFWPSNGKVKMRITAGTGRIYSPPFKFNVDNSFLLKLDNEIGAINASVQILESSNIISFYPYTSGSVPALLINRLSNLTIEYRQSNESLNHKLEPGTHRYYALDYPSGPSKICWWISGREKETESKKVNIVENQLADHTVKGQKMYCISFLDGLQRVILFTPDASIASRALKEVRLERRDIDVHINVHGIGLSLVNDRIGVEIAYISMSSSTCEWKYKNKKGRWQELKGEISQRIENAWLNYQQMIARGQEVSEEVILNEDFKVNFRKMIMIRNHDHPIKRLYSPGIAIEYGKSPSQQYFSVTVNNIQVDNQRSYPYFPVVFCPVPPPKYASEEIAAQPFIQLCVIVKEEERADFKQIQYLRLLIQEMKIQVDRGFIMDMIDIFQERIMPNEDDLFKKDLDYLNSSEVQSDTVSVDEKLKDYYQDLHLSPIKLDLSFSINEGAQTSTNHTDDFVMNSAILDVAINTVGSAATSVRDAQFRLSYFERRNMFYSRKQLISQTIEYYRNQFIQQAYMVVFGLDALGNPSHLFNDFKTGIQDFFYEPYQGAVTGPAEFFEGLGHGVTGLLGHTIGGTFSAASRITDTVGKGFAALSMDKEYQRERQKASSSKPSDLGEGLLRGGKGFAKGLWSGVSGIVTKPIEGAEKEGVSGFFKGVGKGLIGSIAKPTGGVVDMATSTFQGIKSMSGIDKELNRIRPARFIHRDNVIRAYDNHEAQGNHILKGMSKDAFGYDNLQEDAYVAHAFVDRMNRKLIMITTKRILKAEILTENELWKCSWQCNFDDMEELPTSTKENITIMEKKSGLFGVSTVSTKVIDCGTSEIAMWLLLRIKTALDYSKLQFSF